VEVLILAGGRGTRLGELGAARPKALMRVAGEPFVHHQLTWLREQGVTRVVFSIGYLGQQIRDEVGDGTKWGLDATFVDEGDELRGTGGAVRFALDQGALASRFLLLYGDSYLQVDLGDLWRWHHSRGAVATMAVYRNDGRYDRSNVCFEGGQLVRYDKNPSPEWASRMAFIDYGVSVFERSVIEEEPAREDPWDLAELQHRLSTKGRLNGYEVAGRFYEIGTPAGLAELDDLLSRDRLSPPPTTEGQR
jgi:NDP-sugar pyrophosphorylase family protein